MKNSSKIAIHLLIIQCFWSFYSQVRAEEMPVTTLYCHGVCGDSSQMNEYKDLIINGKALNFPDTQRPRGLSFNKIIYGICKKMGKAHINRANMYMGHGKDIDTINNEIDSDQSYILFGLCRGGTAIVNYMAQYNPANVIALVLDEAPANMLDVLTYREIKKKGKKAKLLSPIQSEKKFRFFFPAFPKGATPPEANVASIENKDLVIFLSYCQQPSPFHFPQSTWKMYLAFKNAGFKNVYLCELPDYGQNAQGDNKEFYLQRLHSVYKKHNLPCHAKFATLTDEQLTQLQPATIDVDKMFTEYLNS